MGSFGNATAKIITTSTSGLAKIISSLGGLGTIILWSLVFLVYLYLFMMRIPNPTIPFLFPPRIPNPDNPTSDTQVVSTDSLPPLPPCQPHHIYFLVYFFIYLVIIVIMYK